MAVAGGNEGQATYWSELGGQAWVANQDQMDRQLSVVGAAALTALDARPGESILDVGCGCGATTLELAASVGATGRVVGLDISVPMTQVAMQRLSSAGLHQGSAMVGDAQVATGEEIGGQVDAIFSRFGVMFFADPFAAFTNLRALAKPNARIAFVCWQEASKNRMFSDLGRELGALFPSPAPADPFAPGPLAFADPARVESILGTSGWSRIEITSHVAPMQLFGSTDFDTALEGSLQIGSAARLLQGGNEDTVRKVRDAAKRVLETQWTDQGAVVDSATWIVTAHNDTVA
jgi:SAM-dependent methyltransferase